MRRKKSRAVRSGNRYGKTKELDPVAYVRFASVYREFKDAGTFMDELKKFLQ